jgi:membrane protease YdiL (CAAX protease family)
VPADGSDAAAPEPAPEPGPLAVPGPPPLIGGHAYEPSLWYLGAAGALYAGLLWAVYLADARVVERAETDAATFFWVQLLDDGILTGVALLFGRFRFPGSWRALGFRRVSLRWWLGGAGAGVVAAALAWLVSLAVEHWGLQVPPHPVETLVTEASEPRDLVLVLLAVTVPVAVGEETFFRGYAYRLLRARFGVVAGIGGTAVLFALVHGVDPGAWLPILPVGIVFAVVVERSGSLAPAIVGHAVVNALAVLVG